ncbi:MAG: diaminopimelate epimerase [Planctomycetaceae bacterium]|nr:diaminopimelate epimerase [Planctomycetaceae bacterium]
MKFTKMHGAGNDYVYVDCFSQPAPADPAALARAMSDRRFGIGSDGLILICPAEGADAEMRMYNADGSYSEMCGNGIRCVAKFVYDHGIAQRDVLSIASGGARYALEVQTTGGKVERVRVDMGEPILAADRIPTTLLGNPPTNAELTAGDRTFAVTSVSMGNPHCVIFVDEATDELVHRYGPLVETAPEFPNRVNVEWVEVLDRGRARQRTWERGSGETFACGTGACAVCVAGVVTDRTDRRLAVELLGGELELYWDDSNNHVFMTGPAAEVFSGDWPD